MKKKCVVLLLAFMPLLLLSQDKFVLVEQNPVEKPSWMMQGKPTGYLTVQTNHAATLEDAQKAVMASLLDNIASSVAVQITGRTDVNVDYTSSSYSENISKTTTTEIAEMPALRGISISKAEVYWEKYYNKKTKETYYDYYILYPFSSLDLQKLIEEYDAAKTKPQYPQEWEKYTAKGYFFDVKWEKKDADASDTELVNRLSDAARADVAKQINVEIKDHAQTKQNTIANDGAVIANVDASLVETRSYYNSDVSKMFVIAFIDKSDAVRFYERQINIVFSNVEKYMTIADTYTETGFKSKAKDEIKKADAEFGKLQEPILFLTVFDCPEYDLQEILRRYGELEQIVKRKISDLEYGTNIYVECAADMFGQKYFNLQKELKAKLSETGCNFTDDKGSADWAIIISASSREYNSVNFGGSTTYFSYVDAEIALEKVVTNQRIYEDMITEKGGHTHNFTEAARDAYKKITPKVIDLITENMK